MKKIIYIGILSLFALNYYGYSHLRAYTKTLPLESTAEESENLKQTLHDAYIWSKQIQEEFIHFIDISSLSGSEIVLNLKKPAPIMEHSKWNLLLNKISKNTKIIIFDLSIQCNRKTIGSIQIQHILDTTAPLPPIFKLFITTRYRKDISGITALLGNIIKQLNQSLNK